MDSLTSSSFVGHRCRRGGCGFVSRTTSLISARPRARRPHHGTSIYEVLVRVPLIIRVSGVLPGQVDQPVTQLDIAPTLLDLMGVATPGEYVGQSLVPFLRGQSPQLRRPIAADQRVVRALYAGRYKVMHYQKVGAVELYDLDQDPTESNNLFGQLGGEDDQMFQALRGFFAVHQLDDSWEWRR